MSQVWRLTPDTMVLQNSKAVHEAINEKEDGIAGLFQMFGLTVKYLKQSSGIILALSDKKDTHGLRISRRDRNRKLNDLMDRIPSNLPAFTPAFTDKSEGDFFNAAEIAAGSYGGGLPQQFGLEKIRGLVDNLRDAYDSGMRVAGSQMALYKGTIKELQDEVNELKERLAQSEAIASAAPPVAAPAEAKTDDTVEAIRDIVSGTMAHIELTDAELIEAIRVKFRETTPVAQGEIEALQRSLESVTADLGRARGNAGTNGEIAEAWSDIYRRNAAVQDVFNSQLSIYLARSLLLTYNVPEERIRGMRLPNLMEEFKKQVDYTRGQVPSGMLTRIEEDAYAARGMASGHAADAFLAKHVKLLDKVVNAKNQGNRRYYVPRQNNQNNGSDFGNHQQEQPPTGGQGNGGYRGRGRGSFGTRNVWQARRDRGRTNPRI